MIMKNLALEHDAGNTLFPTATGTLEKHSLGIGARMTTMHYPATEWAMWALDLSLTGNQNSIPRGESKKGTVSKQESPPFLAVLLLYLQRGKGWAFLQVDNGPTVDGS